MEKPTRNPARKVLTDAVNRAIDEGAPIYINITPTWESLMPALIAALQNGTHEGQQIAQEELTRLARAVDAQNARNKGAS